jgi:23S rRNA (cytidine2498-2'-O)-methyltransferase
MPSTFLVTAAPEFESAALDELKGYDINLKPGQRLAPGLFFVSSSVPDFDFTAKVTSEPPTYARHMFPVAATVPLELAPADLDKMAEAVSKLFELEKLTPGTSFAVQARLIGDSDEGSDGNLKDFPYTPYAIKEKLAAVIVQKTGATENIKAPQMVLSVVCSKERAYIGLSAAVDNLSDWAGGVRRMAKMPEQISRAEFKLQEALEVFGLELPSKGRVLDLGAAPGGWTRLLLEAGLLVTAVDPANLDTGLRKYGSRLTHFRGTAQRFLEKTLLDSKKPHRFDIIVGDMRMDAGQVAELLVDFEPLLGEDGFILTTLKLPMASPKIQPEKIASDAIQILKTTYPIVQARQLFHNRQEITLYATRE